MRKDEKNCPFIKTTLFLIGRRDGSVPHLNLEALHVVISHPLVSLVGIRHVLDRVPNLGGSTQESTDLEDTPTVPSYIILAYYGTHGL